MSTAAIISIGGGIACAIGALVIGLTSWAMIQRIKQAERDRQRAADVDRWSRDW